LFCFVLFVFYHSSPIYTMDRFRESIYSHDEIFYVRLRYFLTLRLILCSLVVQKLPKHSQYALPELQKEVSNAKQVFIIYILVIHLLTYPPPSFISLSSPHPSPLSLFTITFHSPCPLSLSPLYISDRREGERVYILS
jgi:hypothetical protein